MMLMKVAPDDSSIRTPEAQVSDNWMHGGNGIPETLQEVLTFMEENTDERPSSSFSANDTENDHPEPKPKPANKETYGEISDVREENEIINAHTDIHLLSHQSNQFHSNFNFEDVLSGNLIGTSGLFQNAHHFEICGLSFSDQSVNPCAIAKKIILNIY
ncbi:hypothetical protein BDQ17DRAFT_1441262 [Cyathus striatus]|nr:hypothetical protein BDQ17DRAFT_1441262 [Cyathus striatus]